MGPPRRSDQPELYADRRQPLVGIVGPQQQAEFGTRGEHPIGLADPAPDQIVDHHADIAVSAIEHMRRHSGSESSRIETGHQSLRGCLFVARRAVDLSGKIKPRHRPNLQRSVELARVDMIILDRVARPDHLDAFETGDRRQQRALSILRQGRRNAVRIDGWVLESLGFEEDLVTLAIAEADDLVLDRGTVARPDTVDVTAIHCRAMQVVSDDLVRRLDGARDAALNLRVRQSGRERRERHRLVVARLHLHRAPIDGPAIQTRRRACLQTTEADSEPRQRGRETPGRFLADPAAGAPHIADMDQAVQKRAGGDHHRAGRQPAAVLEQHGGDPPIDHIEVVRLTLDHGQQPRRPDRLLHRRRIEAPIRLSTRPAHGRTLAAVEHAELNAAEIGDPAHVAVERIDLADQMTLAQAADRRVARHRADRVEAMGDQ